MISSPLALNLLFLFPSCLSVLHDLYDTTFPQSQKVTASLTFDLLGTGCFNQESQLVWMWTCIPALLATGLNHPKTVSEPRNPVMLY